MASDEFVQSGGVIYKNITDLIDNKTYQLKNVPATYRRLPAYFLLEDSGPMPYVPFPGEVYQRTRMTIKHMVDMHFNGIGFTFVNERDMLEVEHYLKQYLKFCEVTGFVKGNHFYTRARNFYDPPEDAPNKRGSSFKTKCLRIRNKLGLKKDNIWDFLQGNN